MIKLGDVVMIIDLHRQGLSVSAIARELGIDRKTVRKYIARGLEPPVYGPRQARSRLIDPYVTYLRERITAYPGLSGRRLLREIRERGYRGGYTAVTETVRDLRPPPEAGYEVRFETPPGEQAQVDSAHFETVFTDEPGVVRKVWLFSLILGYSRLIWARFVQHQDLQTVLRCHRAAFTALGGVPRTILYDRMKTVVTGEPEPGHIVYNRHLVDFAAHHGYQPRACRPYRAKTKGKVERPYRYVRQDFFLARTFRNLEDLNAQLARWLDEVANPRVHATTRRVIIEAFAEERPHLKTLPLAPYRTVLKLERRITRDGMISVGGNLYSVPDATRRRVVEVQCLAEEILIVEDGTVVASIRSWRARTGGVSLPATDDRLASLRLAQLPMTLRSFWSGPATGSRGGRWRCTKPSPAASPAREHADEGRRDAEARADQDHAGRSEDATGARDDR